MADQQQLDQLRKSVSDWNEWKKQHRDILIDLTEADLCRTNLKGANLRGVHLSEALLSEANLCDADLSNAYPISANLSNANLSRANLVKANLFSANLSRADLCDADLRGADLRGADLRGADLRGADLRGADLRGADLCDANLSGTNLSRARLYNTIFGNLDLRVVKGLETVQHDGPSFITTSTLERSQGDIPAIFLKGAGLSDTFIDYARSLTQRSIEYYTCFISYTQKDQAFAERLYSDLQNKGVRCWYAPKELKPGDYYRHRIDESIRVYDKLLVVLSEESIKSAEVEKEVQKAEEREESMPMDSQVLYPIRLDDTVMQTQRRWVQTLRYHRHIGDFTRWKDHDQYQRAFQRLLDDIKHPKPRQRHETN